MLYCKSTLSSSRRGSNNLPDLWTISSLKICRYKDLPLTSGHQFKKNYLIAMATVCDKPGRYRSLWVSVWSGSPELSLSGHRSLPGSWPWLSGQCESGIPNLYGCLVSVNQGFPTCMVRGKCESGISNL